tara:strand:- start:987 stop:2144 length:1158 start_codon:yes stop_codon:yes gene_type:complete
MSCILPFINLEARTDGTMAVCCIMQESAKKDDGTEFNLANGDTLSDVKKSKWLKELQRDFQLGRKFKACDNCWKEEEAGIESKRLRENSFWGEDFFPSDLKSLDLKLGNICNAKCRICSSFASSQWAAEELKLNPSNERARSFNKLGMWPKKNENFWDDIDNNLKKIQKLEFFGGEPLLIDRHYDILEKCVELDIAKDIRIAYNTNASIFPEDKISLWEEFQRVEIFVSLDDIDNRFEYIRHPGNFSEAMYHLALFDKLPKDKFELGIFQTFSIFNICNMEDLTKYLSNYFDHLRIHYNMVFTPNHISPKVLPKRVKEKISLLYKDSPDFVQKTLNFMNGEHYEEKDWHNFLFTTKLLDNHREEKFENTFPILFDMIEKDWNGIQ